jgi:YesN/AraC family two-component response regulator
MGRFSNYIKVLIVDDNIVFVNNFKNLIENVGGDRIKFIDTAFSGEEGLSFLSSTIYDFVFADIDMPGLGGIEMVRIFDHENFRKNTKVIAISFHNEIGYYEQMLSAGAIKYLEKDKINFESIAELFESKI